MSLVPPLSGHRPTPTANSSVTLKPSMYEEIAQSAAVGSDYVIRLVNPLHECAWEHDTTTIYFNIFHMELYIEVSYNGAFIRAG